MSDTTPEVSAELVAAIEDAEPWLVIAADKGALVWFEMAHAAVACLGLSDELHGPYCLEPSAEDPELLEKAATSAEQMLTALRGWMQEHGVPYLSAWFYSTLAEAFMHVGLSGATRVTDQEADE